MTEHVPTDESRRVVAVLSAQRIPMTVIAKAIGVSEKTVRKHYEAELADGRAISDAGVISCAYRMAVSGRHPAMTMFWLKTQLGWREVTRVETVGADGKPIEQSVTIKVQYADIDANTPAIAPGAASDPIGGQAL